MKKIDYALERINISKEFIMNTLCPNQLSLKDREDCEDAYDREEYPCENCWNQEVEGC